MSPHQCVSYLIGVRGQCSGLCGIASVGQGDPCWARSTACLGEGYVRSLFVCSGKGDTQCIVLCDATGVHCSVPVAAQEGRIVDGRYGNYESVSSSSARSIRNSAGHGICVSTISITSQVAQIWSPTQCGSSARVSGLGHEVWHVRSSLDADVCECVAIDVGRGSGLEREGYVLVDGLVRGVPRNRCIVHGAYSDVHRPRG